MLSRPVAVEPRFVLALGLMISCFSQACDDGNKPETVAPAQAETAPTTDTQGSEAQAQEISPAVIAGYQGMVRDVYFSDFERCLEDQMEAEETMYMRSAFTLDIALNADGSTAAVTADPLVIKVRNYEGQDLSDGDAQAMTDCIVTAAKAWEFEPAPGAKLSFKVDSSVGD